MGRAPCCDKVNTVKGVWTKEEDERLIAYIQEHGHRNWKTLPKAAGLRRCGKSCRLRWLNYLRPDLKKGSITPEESDLILSLHSQLGNKWSQIAAMLHGRSDNDIKNYWNCHLKRQLIARGIDPVTHQPLNTAAAPTDAPANSEVVSEVTIAAQKEASNNTNGQVIRYFNVDLNVKAEDSDVECSEADSEGSSSNANGVNVNTTEEAHRPQINLEISLALPFQPKDANNSGR